MAKRGRPRGLAAEIGKRHGFESPEQEAFLNIMRTGAQLGGAFQKLFREHGLSEATYNVLRILRGERESTGSEEGAEGVACQVISERLVARGPDVTRLVDRLERDGLVGRTRDLVDRRIVTVSIKERGLELLARLDEPTLALHGEQLGHLSREELRTLNELLVKARGGVGDGVAAATG